MIMYLLSTTVYVSILSVDYLRSTTNNLERSRNSHPNKGAHNLSLSLSLPPKGDLPQCKPHFCREWLGQGHNHMRRHDNFRRRRGGNKQGENAFAGPSWLLLFYIEIPNSKMIFYFKFPRIKDQRSTLKVPTSRARLVYHETSGCTELNQIIRLLYLFIYSCLACQTHFFLFLLSLF
jgi:hypothetical protein